MQEMTVAVVAVEETVVHDVVVVVDVTDGNKPPKVKTTLLPNKRGSGTMASALPSTSAYIKLCVSSFDIQMM
jgi:hypothetical protein